MLVKFGIWLSSFSKNVNNYLISGNFKKDLQGQGVYYPNGSYSQGYIVTDFAEYQRLHIWRTKLFLSSFLVHPLILFNLWFWAFFLIFISLWYYLVGRYAFNKLEKSDIKLTFKEFYQAQMPYISLPFIIFVGCWFLSILIKGITHESDTYSDIDRIVDLVAGIIGTICLGTLITMKIRYLNALNATSKNWKKVFYFLFHIFVIILSVIVAYTALVYVFIYLVIYIPVISMAVWLSVSLIVYLHIVITAAKLDNN